MPLGKLSRKQIESAYKILSEVQAMVKEGTGSDTKFLDASSSAKKTRIQSIAPSTPRITSCSRGKQSRANGMLLTVPTQVVLHMEEMPWSLDLAMRLLDQQAFH